MTKAKNTKRALLASLLSMVLCIAMLIGSTFAWFTDSVTSGKNRIVAGNLDIELYYKNADTKIDTTIEGKDNEGYLPVTKDTNVFMQQKVTGEDGTVTLVPALWEPGHVEVINLKIANVGTLALKYALGINIADEEGSVGTAPDGKPTPFKLSDYIEFAIIDGDEEIADRAAAIAKAGAESVQKYKLSELAANDGAVLYPEDKVAVGTPSSEKKVTLIVYMPDDVGNEANWVEGATITLDDGTTKPATAPEITLGIKLYATQTPMEEDSFGDDYDEGLVPSEKPGANREVVKAINNGIADANAKLKDTAFSFGEMVTEEDGTKSITLHTGGNPIMSGYNAFKELAEMIEGAVDDEAANISSVVTGFGTNYAKTYEVKGTAPTDGWLKADLLKNLQTIDSTKEYSVQINDMSGVQQQYKVVIAD